MGHITRWARFALVIGLVCSDNRVVAGVPEWLKQAAQAPMPAYSEDVEAVVLLNERLTTVLREGEIRTTYRKACRILRPAGRSRSIVYVYFDSETQVTFLKAWSITAENEEYEVKEKDAVETAAFSGSLYGDERYKVLQIPGVHPGSVIGYEYQQRQRPFVQQEMWAFQDSIPVRRTKFTLELPKAWRYSEYWRNHSAVSPQRTGENRWTWELADIEAIPLEPEMPPRESLAGALGISFGPGEPNSSWELIGRWYGQLASGRGESTPTIRDKARDLVAGASDPVEKIHRLASYVQHEIRYVAIEIGVGGYQPHAAQEVLASGYGDCKDKANLLKTMLREAGIDSYFLLVNSDRDYVASEFASLLDFNHVILAIHVPDGDVENDTITRFRHKKLGRLLFLDPTDDATPIGYLPPSLQASHGLLVTDAGGELLTLPLWPPSVNRILRVGKLSLDKDGTLKGTVQEVRSGPSATAFRQRLVNVPRKERQRIFEDMLTELVDGAVLTAAATSDLKDFSGTVSLTYDFTAHGFAQNAGNLFLFRSCVLGRKGRTLLEDTSRKQPVEFSHTASEGDLVEISLPTEYVVNELPEAVKYEYPFGLYKSETRVADHVLHLTRTFELRDVRVPRERMEDLKKFYREISDDEHAYTIMRVP
jgi:hypothetical protein